MFQVILIIVTALGVTLPVVIELVAFIPKTAWPAENEKAKRVCLVEQPESTYGSTASGHGVGAVVAKRHGPNKRGITKGFGPLESRTFKSSPET